MSTNLAIVPQFFLTSPDALADGFRSGAFLSESGLSLVQAVADTYIAACVEPDEMAERLKSFGTRLSEGSGGFNTRLRILGLGIARAIRHRRDFFERLLPRVRFQLQLFDDGKNVSARARQVLAGELEPEISFPGRGRFSLVKTLASGGHSLIYLAMDRVTGEKVAVKVFDSRDEDLFRRWGREVKFLRRLDHPNIPRFFHFGRDAGYDGIIDDTPLPYIVMEYADGGDLMGRLELESFLNWKEVGEIAIQLCLALQAAHEAGIVHRDVKAENIVLKNNGEKNPFVQLIDWHTALDLNEAKQREEEIAYGPIGTPAYMAPEQIRGDRIDARTDIYGLGVVLFGLLTGKMPFKGMFVEEVCRDHLNTPPRRLKEVRPDLDIPDGAEAIVLKALAKKPADRFQSMAEMAEAIERCR